MTMQEATARTVFDVSALYYDLLRPGGADTSLARSLASRGDVVLDLGAGTGANSLALAGLPTTVYAFEPNRAMRTAFLSRVSLHPELLPRVTVLPLGADDDWEPWSGALPSDRSANLALLLGVVHMLDQPARRRTLQNIRRLLRPGGLVAMDGVTATSQAAPVEVVLGETQLGELTIRGHLRTQRREGGWSTTVDYVTTCGGTPCARETVTYPSFACTMEEFSDDLNVCGFEPVPVSEIMRHGDSTPPPDGLVTARALPS